MVLLIAAALCGAFFLAVGFVVQQHAAFEEPPDERLSWRLIAHLVRRPVWLAGIAAMAAGQILGAIALANGDIALVEPIMASNLLFALPLAALWRRRRLGAREWSGGVILIAGLAAFIAAGDPHSGSTQHLSWPSWVVSSGTIIAVAGFLVLVSRRFWAAPQASLLAAAAGSLYGLQDALTERSTAELSKGGLLAMIDSWPVFLLVAVAVCGLFLAQSAFEAAPLAASLPLMTVLEPLTGICFGIGVYGEHLNLAGPLLAVELAGFAGMVVGVFMLAGSPIVTGERRPEPAEACEKAA